MILTDILIDGFFAAVAGIGFGAISDPSLRCSLTSLYWLPPVMLVVIV